MDSLNKTIEKIKKEIESGNKKYKSSFHSTHELLGSLLLEVDEFKNEIQKDKNVFKSMTKEAEKEAIQIAAVIIKGIVNFTK